MALFTLSTAGALYEVLDGSITLPLLGAPVAHLELGDDQPPLPGPAVLQIARDDGELDTFSGTLLAVPGFEGRARATFVGGGGGLGAPARALHQTSAASLVRVSDLVSRIVAGAGEELAPGTLEGLAGLTVQRWTRCSGETWARALTRVLHPHGMRWRVLDSGLVWAGADTWPEASDSPFVRDEDLDAHLLEVAFDQATLRPGTMLGGRQVVRVTYLADGRAEVELDDDAGDATAGLVRRLATPDPYTRVYNAVVVVQHEDGTVDVRLLGAPVAELTRVLFDTGVVGARYVLPPGAAVRVAFAAGAPGGAWAFGSPHDPSAARGVARVGDEVSCGSVLLTPLPAPASGVQFTWVPPSGDPVTVSLVGQLALAPGPTTFQLRGVIASGSPEVKLR